MGADEHVEGEGKVGEENVSTTLVIGSACTQPVYAHLTELGYNLGEGPATDTNAVE